MMRWGIAACTACLVVAGMAPAAATQPTRHDEIRAAAQQANGALGAGEYAQRLLEALKPALAASKTCPRPSWLAMMRGVEYAFAFTVDAEGRIHDASAMPDNATTRCAVRNIGQTPVPRPPRPGYPFYFTLKLSL